MRVKGVRRSGKEKDGLVTQILDENNYNEKGIEVEIDDYCIVNVTDAFEDSLEKTSVKKIRDLIEKHETETFEMKASFKYDLELSQRLGKPVESPVLKRKIVEEAVSFMNCDGGTICIGVDNNKNIVGLENDYKLLSNYEEGVDEDLLADKLSSEIKQTISDYIKDDLVFTLFKTETIPIDGKKICLVNVKKSSKPMFVKMKVQCRIDNKDTKEDIWKCWIRSDKGIREINFESFLDFWMDRDKDHS